MPDAPNVRFDIASFGELLSDPSRVAMLLSLMHGLTRPATELAEIFTNARTCYQHLGGKLGVAWLSALQRQRLLRAGGGGLELSPRGIARCGDAGLIAPEWPSGKPCLDWTERQNHLGGPLGSLLTQGMLQQEWLVRRHGGRAVRLTTRGRRKLAGLGVEVPEG